MYILFSWNAAYLQLIFFGLLPTSYSKAPLLLGLVTCCRFSIGRCAVRARGVCNDLDVTDTYELYYLTGGMSMLST